jgi:AraC-like DNA-binding protein
MNTTVSLVEGDLVILPHGHAHTITDHPNTPVTRIEELEPKQSGAQVRVIARSGPGAVTTLVCGGFLLEETINPLISMLPPVLLLSSIQEHAAPSLQAIVQLVQTEASTNQQGATMMINRCSELLFLQAVRGYLSSAGDGHVGWYSALKDPQIGQALALIHQQPGERWTVEGLARHVYLSRSGFSAKFKHLVGEAPMEYLTRVRLMKAATLLRTHPGTLLEVALTVGYDSEVSFSKTFKRYFGMAPGAYRQAKRLPLGSGTLNND